MNSSNRIESLFISIRRRAEVCWVVWLLMGLAPLRGADEGKNDAKDGQTVREGEKPANPLSSFGKAVPEGVKNTGVWIPGFEKGRKTTLVEAESVTRVDENRLIIAGLVIHLYGKNPTEDVQVDLSTATYHMTNEILRSATRSKVSRADFDLEGDSMIFDTLTSQGRMIGNVRMTIHDTGAFMKPEKADSEARTTPEGTAAAPQSPAAAGSHQSEAAAN